jgi:phage/plasmid-like protein (TIGR03299 family)
LFESSKGITPKTNKEREKHMASEIINRDVQVGLEMAWHGKTKVVETVTKELAFPFEIERKPIYVMSPKVRKVKDFEVFVCSDDNEIAGKPVQSSYNGLTNERYWEVIQNSLGGTKHQILSAGTLFDRSRRFVTVKLENNPDFKVGDREFKANMTLLDSIDGTWAIRAINTDVNTVCANTARKTLRDKSGEFQFSVRHTEKMSDKLTEMERAIESLVGVAAQYNAAMLMAHETPISTDTARNLFVGFLGREEKELSTRSLNTASRLHELFTGGAGNRGETVLDAISAVTDYYSHESSGGENRYKQFVSSEYGSGSRKKTEFISSLFILDSEGDATNINWENIKAMEARGAALIAN